MSDRVHVNLDALKDLEQKLQRQLDTLEGHAKSSASGQIAKASQDASWLGGFATAGTLDQAHRQTLVELRQLIAKIRQGIQTAQSGINQVGENYRSVDEQKRLEFEGIDRRLGEHANARNNQHRGPR